MWMPPIEPGWAGKVQFYELLFGTWTVYAFLVWLWQSVLKEPLQEWRYAMITFLGASAFWINHYFLQSPFWLTMINVYTVGFVILYWWLAIRGRPTRSFGWKALALGSSVLFTVAFIGFEQLARLGVERWGMHEFCWMTLSFIGFVWLIAWRGRAVARARAAPDPQALPRPDWRGAGGSL